MPCSQMAKNSRVSNITSLPKIRSVSRNEEMMPCDTQQTLAMTSLNEDNSLVILFFSYLGLSGSAKTISRS